MKRIKFVLLALLMLISTQNLLANPVKDLLERIDKGSSKNFIIEKTDSDTDYFELSNSGDKIVISGNTYVNISAGLNWYLKYYLGVHLSWNSMTCDIPNKLPKIDGTLRKETPMSLRYYLNYCTYSYSMAFWDWEHWEREIDWMALHGINLPLAVTGTDVVWRNVLKKLGYDNNEISQFIAGPGFQAWWLMNNLEGWGGPNPDSWYDNQEKLQKKVVKRMREMDIEPVFAGYSGMVPHDAKQRLGLNVSDPGLWCSYKRPAFLLPTDDRFEEIASLYYDETEKLYGKSNYYSMDPFHEGGSVAGVDLPAAGKAIMQQMKNANPTSKWVIMTWQANPRDEMIKDLTPGDLVVVDLFAESRPQWGEENSTWARKDGFGKHTWLYGMLLNFGGNVGLHGKMQHVIDSYYGAKNHEKGAFLDGVGLTMEGIENNAIMYELVSELPWRNEKIDKNTWLNNYISARYGSSDKKLEEAWQILSNSIYNCPAESTQQGTSESIFCTRPSMNAYQASSWSEMTDYYDPQEVIRAAEIFASVADNFKGNNNYEYDLVDIARQALAEKGRIVFKLMQKAYKDKDIAEFNQHKSLFLDLILKQDRLLSSRKEFQVGTWIEQAKSLGKTQQEKHLYEWNARVQITTWGNRTASEDGGLRDYAHREWNGLLKDFYYVRWAKYLDNVSKELQGESPEPIDFYALDEIWTKEHKIYQNSDSNDVMSIVKECMK